MKAVILCAGEGERLRPLTLTTPKPLLEIGGRPLLERTIAWLRGCGVVELFINLHHLGKKIRGHVGDGSRLGVRITYSEEKTLLGTAGALRAFAPHLDEPFVVVYGDVVADPLDLANLARAHAAKGGVGTLVLQRTDRPGDADVIEVDRDGRVLAFHKTPGDFRHGDLSSAALYVLEPDVLHDVPPVGAADFVADVFPRTLARGARLYGYVTDKELLDIGTPGRLAEARRRYG
jgi:mannose-1-phosphate guanylyltransferase/phosphomannomutase